MLFAERSVVGSYSLTIVGVGRRLHLVDEVADRERVVLRGTEHQRLLLLVDLIHENLHAMRLALLDLDDFVEVALDKPVASVDVAFYDHIIRRVDVFIERGRDLPDLERRKEPVVDAVLQRIDVDGVAEIRVRVCVVVSLGGRCESELHRRREVLEYAAPVTLVVGAASVTLINDDEVEEVGWILTEVRRWRTVVIRFPTHERLKDCEEQATVLRDLSLLRDVGRVDAHECVLGESGERVVSLIGEDVSVGQKENARSAFRFSAQVPPTIEELPRNLESNECLAGACREREKNALVLVRNRLQHAINGDVLIVAAWV